MKSQIAKSTLALAASVATLFGVQDANASLVGDEINIQLTAFEGSLVLIDTVEEVGADVEGIVSGNRNSSIAVDVHAESFDLIYEVAELEFIGFDSLFRLSDLNWVGTPGQIVDVVRTDSNDDISTQVNFGADWIEVTVPDFTVPPPARTFSFDIVAVHDGDPVPDAGASILFLSLGLLPIFGANLRKRS